MIVREVLLGHSDDALGRSRTYLFVSFQVTRVSYWAGKPLLLKEAYDLRNNLPLLRPGHQCTYASGNLIC